MPIIIRNLAERPVFLTLTSGATLHLAPRASSPKLNDVEVKNNNKIDKLKNNFVIAVDVADGIDAPAVEAVEEAKEASKKTSKRKETLNTAPDNP